MIHRTFKTAYTKLKNLFSTPPFALPCSGQALDRLVAVSSMPYGTSTPALSTSSSSRGLTLAMGYLILRGASRLDAFSVYPVPTWLPGRGVDRQPVHQRSVHPGPLVLRTAPLKYPTPRRIGTELSLDVLNPARVPL